MQMFRVELLLQVFFCCVVIAGSSGTESDICDLLYSSVGDNENKLSDEESKQVYRHIFPGYLPKSQQDAGRYNKLEDAADWTTCLSLCCTRHQCDVVLFTLGKCYHIKCKDEPADACQPVRSSSLTHNKTMMVVIRGVFDDDKDVGIRDVLSATLPSSTAAPADKSLQTTGLLPVANRNMTTLGPVHHEAETTSPRPPPPSSSSSLSSSSQTSSLGGGKHVAGQACAYGLQECVEHAICRVPPDSKRRQGLCQCDTGFRESPDHLCVPVETNIDDEQETPPPKSTTTTPPPITKLIVSAGKNQTLQLPENQVTLNAFVLPKPEEGVTYSYEWSSVKFPDNAGSASMEGKNTDTLKLSNLIAGEYVLKIKVTGKNRFGEAAVNVTVVPPQRKNAPPRAIINPTFQEVYLPNSAILDGSGSTDDDKIVSYKWEEVSAPIQSKDMNKEGQMLTVKGLVPGNYTFRLTVIDSDGATNSTQANVTIKKEKDYPPKADAGSDVVIHLPQNYVTLYGNGSSDDNGKLQYEWSKVTQLTGDITGVRTPFLHLSNLEVGDYKFTLKVTDDIGQTDTADVHVFVKPRTNQPPVAKTAGHLNLFLPQESITLDGSSSTDDGDAPLEYSWTQTGGPNTLTINDNHKVIAIAGGPIQEGDYEFQLTVTDGERQQSSEKLFVTIKKDINEPPKAQAGGDKVLEVPVNLVALDGSASSDDHGIKSFLWQRDSKSLAIGTIVNGSDHKAVLQLVNLVEGQYKFTLMVEDTDGLTNSDSATIVVKNNPHKKDIVEMILDADIKRFTMANRESLEDQLELLMQKSSEDRDTKVDFVSVQEDISTGYVVTRFKVLRQSGNDQQVIKGTDALDTLHTKLDSGMILDYSIIRLDLVVCQNNCSGHGRCDQYSKQCICEAFWMPNLFTFYVSTARSNCDWSILYVVIICFLIVVAIISLVWIAICCCTSKKCKVRLKNKRRHRYSLLRDTDNDSDKDKIEMMTKNSIQNSSVMISESDLSSDEETLFVNHRKTSNGLNGKLPNGSKSYRNTLKT